MKTPVVFSLLEGVLTADGSRQPLTAREHAFLALLAVSSRPRTAADLGSALWPDADGDGARNCAKVYAHRVRSKARRADILRWVPPGYALGGQVEVDTRRIEATITAARLGPGASLREQVDDALVRVARAGTAAARGVYEVERYLAGLAAELATIAFHFACERGEPPRAVDAGRQLIAFDPCDELGYELVIRGHLKARDAPRAWHAYRDLARALRHSLDAEPSERVRALLADPAGEHHFGMAVATSRRVPLHVLR